MYKLLIVDDEPLVQVGIKSMLNWAELDIKVIGAAVNGQAALKIIYEQSPDIVITDRPGKTSCGRRIRPEYPVSFPCLRFPRPRQS